ncbi:MAG TPA: PAS domain-containing protein [Peptococcaceae bacterium]|nr:PAS domain-containing protein [Peptococcaceae bacterium]
MVNNKSIIQSTFIKITVSIFAILLILYFFLARIYWNNEVLTRELELLTVASKMETVIENNYQSILGIKTNKNLNDSQKYEQINNLFEVFFDKLSQDYKNIQLGYYDLELNQMVFYPRAENDNLISDLGLKTNNGLLLEEATVPRFISDVEVFRWDGKGIIAAVVPVCYKGEIVGQTWAMLKAEEIYHQSYLSYSKYFIPSLVIIILVLFLIDKNLVKIKYALDDFTAAIINDRPANLDKFNLPELWPVYEKIHNYLANLKLLNERLEESNTKLITIMQGIADGFFSLDRQWCFTFVNEEAKRLLKKEQNDLLGKCVWDELLNFLPEKTVHNLRQAMEQNITRHWEEKLFPEARCYEFYAYPFVQGLNVFFRDITELKQKEQELSRLERLNLIGQMAAGISHEVRNPLTTVRGFLQMLEEKTNCSRNKEYMEIMISEIDRANGIITDFLSLAKSNSDSTKIEDINEIISRLYPMLQADAFNDSKEIVINLGQVPLLELNRSEIKQLILNLVHNGLEETPVGGKVEISTYLEDDRVVLAIRDEGKGIPEDIQEKIGTPFFTTKETGTGLGLAISIGIARRHQAHFRFQTGPNGTTFYISFPIPGK